MGGKKIDCYLDLSSFFSYVAFADLASNMDRLAANGVEVELHPVLLGAINKLSGNKPPWALEAKARYLDHDSQRAAQRVGLALQAPEDLMAAGQTASPLRALHYIKAAYPAATFRSALHFLFHRFWTRPNASLRADGQLRECLLAATETPGAGRKLFAAQDVDRIMAKREDMKQVLMAETSKAVALGAFGAPWFWVTNEKGQGQPFFGSDRFNHIYKHLGIPFQDVAVLTPSKL